MNIYWPNDFGATISSQAEVKVALDQLVTVMGTTPWRTQGNQIIDPYNQPFQITGVNWFGLETLDYAPHGLWARNYKDMMDQMKELDYNTIRLPFSNQLFEEGSIPNGIDFNLNSDLQGLSGLEILDKIVDYAGQIGLHIILDRHRPSANGQSELWYTDTYSEERWIADWQMLATRYSNNPTIIGADLHNEPHGSATWGSGDENTDWRLVAEQAGNAILETNPNWLIFVQGIEWYEGNNYWWGGNLKGVQDYPVRLNIPDRLVYSAHDYPKSVGDKDYPLPWFQSSDYPNNLPAVWDSYWGYIHKQNIAPVLMGEFGSKYEADSDTQDRQWLEQIVNYLDEESEGLNWTYWAWNPEDQKTGGILKDDWSTINVDKQNLLNQIINPSPSDLLNKLNTGFTRFQNTGVLGTYLFAGPAEAANIRQNYPGFKEEGLAFQVGIEPNDDLLQFTRFQNTSRPGTYLFAGLEESANIRQNYPNFKEEGVAFYALDSSRNLGTQIYRFQNTNVPGTYLFVGAEERDNILANFPNFRLEGEAFEVVG